jgi:penicillin-binding protein 1B
MMKQNRTIPVFRILLMMSVAAVILFVFYLVHLDNKVTERFEGRIWQLPSHVYARPLELYVGKPITHEQMQFELDYLNYEPVSQMPHQPAHYRRWDDNYEIRTRGFTFWDGVEESILARVTIVDGRVSAMVQPYTGEGIDLLRFDAGYLTGIFPAHSEDRVLVRIDDVPDIFIKMLLLVEDRRFFEHYGVDPRSIARALVANISSGRTVQGGSTLTQQLVKNLFLTQERTLTRKLNEALMAFLLEIHYDKRLILETYLNEIYLGQDGRRAIHGFGLASRFYFDKKLSELSIDEMAILVGMVKGASFYNPRRQPERSAERRDVVLDLMSQQALITPRQRDVLSARPVKTVKHASAGKYPAFIDTVKHQLQQDYDSDDLRSEGLRVFTTLDPYIQHVTEQAVKTILPRLSPHKDLQAAAVVVSPDTGELLSVIGDREPTFRGFNRAMNAERPVGSLMKPLVYLAALEYSDRYTMASLLDDTELVYRDKHQKDWRPQNYDHQFHGFMTMYEALLVSRNIPAVRTALDVGLDKVRKVAVAMGASGDLSSYPSMALGATSMSPLEVASIYQSFATNGFNSPLRSVRAVLDRDNRPLERYAVDISSDVDPRNVAIINSALIDVTRYGTAKRLSENLPIQVAGKTGTSDDLRDSWFAGFSADAVAVVWTGFDDNRPTRLTGSSGAMKVWQAIMKDVAHRPYQVAESGALERAWVNADDGLLSQQGCENAIELLFIAGTRPQTFSDNRRDCDLDENDVDDSNWFFDLFR